MACFWPWRLHCEARNDTQILMSSRRLLFLTPAQAVTAVFPALRNAGYELGIAENLKGASVFIKKSGPDVIFSRPSLPGFRVEDLLAVGAEDPNFPPVIVITDKGNPEEAERLFEQGKEDAQRRFDHYRRMAQEQ